MTQARSPESDSGGTVLLVDGHSLAYRAFYGYPAENFMTSTGQHTNAVYGFMTLLCAVVRAEQPTHIGVAFDRSRITFRTKEYDAYKATRSATPDEFKGQVELIKDLLDAMNVARVDLDDFEADDIIATWVTQARDADLDVLISTGDRDSFQLVTEEVTVLYPGRNEVQRMTPGAIQEKYGVPPQRYPELAALVGETSDNLPGVPGVGPKTAAKWINEYDGLENLIRRAEAVPGKAGQSFRDHLDDVTRNRRLNALVRDLDLPVGVAGLSRTTPDMAAVNELCDVLQFRALRDRVRDAFDQAPPQPMETVVHEVTIQPAGQVASWLERHGSGPAGVEFEGQWGHGVWDLTSAAIAAADQETAWFDVRRMTPADDAAMAAWLADEDRAKIVHDSKEPLIGLWEHGWDLRGVICDTQLAAYLANPDRRDLSLSSLAELYLHRTVTVGTGPSTDQPAFDFEQPDTAQAAGLNARTIADVAQPLLTEVASQESASLLTDLEIPLTRVLGRMEMTGIAVDLDVLTTLRRQFDDRVALAQQQAFDAIGHPTNLSSPKQLQVVLFDELMMPKTRKTKSGYTTDAEALDHLFSVTGHPFLEHLLSHRDAIKLRQTVEGLIKAVADDGRIHTTYLQTAAATGRLSSQDPNLQNIPTRTLAGNQIRQAFVPQAGYEALMTADYSQIEMRIMAHVSGDERLIDAFRSGQDFHTVMAAHVFDVDAAQVTPAQRSRVKAVNYGLAYGLSAYGLSNQLKISVGEATTLMDGYFEEFGRVRDYLNSLVAQARTTGYTQTLMGRRRYLPDLASTNRTRRDMAERMALNAPIQGSAADIIKVAMLKVASALEKDFRSRMLLQVHDELVFEVADGEREALELMVREQMSNAVRLDVPLDVSVGVGATWAGAAH
ncbi:MAG: DNA polymerase I [Propionibacteriaceae bacterium]|nr:DNA polymerase I [Propionibacteriaceae bacterium]